LRQPIAALFLVLALSASAASAQFCSGVGYTPTQFAGKPDPWPGNRPLPNDELAAAYFARYGQHPGNPSQPEGLWVPGYFDELNFVTYGALENAANASAIGPGGEKLHPGCPTVTEQTDFAFAVPKGSPYVFTWFVSTLDGSSAAKAITQHDPLKPCGLSSIPKSLFAYWPIYYTNPEPCGTPPPACGDGHVDPGETCQTCPADAGTCPPVCGDGHIDPGETCETCPQDAGACPPPVCPTLTAIPDTATRDCTNLLQILKRGSGQYAAAARLCRIVTGAVAYQPKP